jgi:erythromycin esterase-like protein
MGTVRTGDDTALLDAIRGSAVAIEGNLRDYDALLEDIGSARVVLLGEATHGTAEFYRERALITRRLIVEKGFSAVTVEADWPDAYRANRYVRGISTDVAAVQALEGFGRFPTWMWRNTEVVDFLEWLRSYNDAHHEAWSAVGFYGMDLYSLYTSIQEVVAYLEQVDPEGAARARARYGCFDRVDRNVNAYAWVASRTADGSCEEEVVEQLLELLDHRSRYLAEDEVLAEDEFFFAEQNARLVQNAERYYRTMYQAGTSSWNLRDRHMVDTLRALHEHLALRVEDPKLVVWAHNSHLGDARATSMGRAGEWNVGQLVREAYGEDCYLLGFTTHSGTVTAATDWEAPADRRRVRPALPDSYESLFHRVGLERFFLSLREPGEALGALHDERLERAIGVVYRPQSERQSHYFACDLASQFDGLLHFDHTRALEPLERTPRWESGEPPLTFPTAF